MAFQKVLLIYMTGHEGKARQVHRDFSRFFVCDMLCRDDASPQVLCCYDLIVTLGGDGTLLRASQHVVATPMLGINVDPQAKEGYLLQCGVGNYLQYLQRIVKKMYRVRSLARLACFVNAKKISSLALNEFYVGHSSSHQLSHYLLHIGSWREQQKSSGILVSTAAGSTGWARAAGGRKLPLFSQKIQFVVREPYVGRLSKARHVFGFCEKVEIVPLHDDYIIVPDSQAPVHHTSKGDRILITRGPSLPFVVFY